MAFDYDEGNPADDSLVSAYPTNERAQRLAVKGSVEVDHDAEGTGKHNSATLIEQGSDPTTVANEVALYTKETGSIAILFLREEGAGTVRQLTDAEGLLALQRTAGASEAARRMLANLLLSNALKIQGRDVGDAAWIDLLSLDASDRVVLGGTAQAARVQSTLLGHHYDGTTERAMHVPRGYVDGYLCTRATTTTISVAAGACASDDWTRPIIKTGADVLDVGVTGAGGLEVAVVADTWYALWAILNGTTGAVDVFGSTGLSPTLPAGFTLKQRCAWFRTNASSQVTDFIQLPGGRFLWKDPTNLTLDVNFTGDARTEQTVTLTNCPPSVRAVMHWQMDGNNEPLWVYATDVTSGVPGEGASPLASMIDSGIGAGRIGARIPVDVDASRQIHYRTGGIDAAHNIHGLVMGWDDPRGAV